MNNFQQTIISMRHTKAMRNISQQSQSLGQQSVSESQDQMVIEQYNQLTFSDQFGNESNSSQQHELTPDKLKKLGLEMNRNIDKYMRNVREGSSTREDLYRRELSSTFYNINDISSRSNSHLGRNRAPNLDKTLQQCSAIDERTESFDINSFLNSQPVMHKVARPAKNSQHKARKQFNANSLREVLQEHEQASRQPTAHYLGVDSKRLAKQYQRKNNSLRDFINRSIGNREISKGETIPQEESIDLVTLPEPDNKINQARPRIFPTRHGLAGGSEPTQQQCLQPEQMLKMQQIRFEQAKINFMDNFLPESMRIGNNSYNFWKYAHSRQQLPTKIL